MFSNVIVKKPAKSYVTGLTTSDLGVPNYELALQQHEGYINALKQCGVDVTYLNEEENFPDSTFVEDTAVLTKEFAIITNPGAPTRRDEVGSMRPVIESFYETVYTITAPGTLEGGDVMQLGKTFFIGLSTRTNKEGAEQFKAFAAQHGYTTHFIPLEEFFHLKTGIVPINEDTVVIAGEFLTNPLFGAYRKITVDPDELYAANCIQVNDYIIVPAGFPKAKARIEAAGLQTIEVGMSEFQKQDGGLSCLSLRF